MLRTLVFGMMAIILSSTLLYGQAAAPGDNTATISAQVRDALKKLDASSDTTAASRINLANVAIQNKAWEAAHEALLDAARLEPGNQDVAELMKEVVKNLPPPPPPATKPVAPPTTNAASSATKPAPVAFTVKREVTPAEINRIRQLEWRPDEKPTPVIHVDQEIKRKFLATSPDVTPSDFNKMTPDAQAAMILASGKEDLYPGITFKTDPASMKEFKVGAGSLGVNRIIVQSCSKCHTGNKAGGFSLYTDTSNDAAVYTNFLILQNYAANVGGAERLMVDRTNPEGSLLAQFMLDKAVASFPHPNVKEFKAPAKTENDPKYQVILKWLKSLDPIAPKYGIDISKAEEPAKAK